MAYKVNVDAGHGSNTAGKRTAPFTRDVDINGDGKVDVKKGETYKEHYANVAVCVELEKELKRCGIAVNKTGWNDGNATDDSDVALSTRQAQIKAAKCDISVSVHFNAAGNATKFVNAEGVSTHYHALSSKSGDSKRLAEIVQSHLIKGTKQKNRGTVKQELAMCNCPSTGTKAAILVELAFMDNEREAMKLMANSKFHKEAAQEIAKGICQYAGIKYVEETVVAEPQKAPVKATKEPEAKDFRVKLLTDLNIRTKPDASTDKTKTGKIAKKNEVFTIVETSGTFGKLKSGAGWISISEKYVKRV